MPLTHVCVWDGKNGYRRVSIEEASQMYPYGVAANRGIFVCSLCAQNVGLTAPGANVRHFRHTSAAQKKECEDRAQAYARANDGYSCHPMPIRIKVSHNSYLLELGFFHAPSPSAGGLRCQSIKIVGENSQEFIHSFERISSEGITYLNVGSIPSSRYHLFYDHPSPNLNRYWPSITPGVDPKGSFFECSSGRMLYSGSKAYPYQDYFLLQRNSLPFVPNGISYKKLTETRTGSFTTWYLYKIHVNDFSVSVARFFLERSIFLTEQPVVFYPVWPPYVEDPYFLYHNDPTMYFYMQGEDAELNTYPASIAPRFLNIEEGKLYKIYAASKEQLLSLGQSGAIGFSYLMKKNLDMVAALPQLQIKNIDGKLVVQDICNQLPKGKQITIQAPFDGKIVILRNGNVLEIRNIAAEQITNVDNLSFGYQIQIFQGCDLLRTICFEKLQSDTNYTEQDRQLVEKLRRCKGTKMPMSHNIGAVAKQLSHFPLSRQWLYQTIRQGKISADAIKLLASYKNIKIEDKKL